MTTNGLHERISGPVGFELEPDPTITGDCPHDIDPFDPEADVEGFHLSDGRDVLIHPACGGLIPEQ